MVRRRAVATWIAWIALMVAATVVMVLMRDSMDQVHVILVYLLIILGASTAGGRLLALPLACAGFLLIDYYFQSPYGSISAGKPLDWVALVSFLVTALVATHLLARAQSEADEAERRAVEIASLARLGSETLSAGRAEDALARISEVIQTTLGMSDCSITPWDGNPATPA
jgi:two-component system, OmpR family, sensor histidine kinase KdpD